MGESQFGIKEVGMAEKVRFPFDRRTGEDRRKKTDRAYFRSGGIDMRSGKDRRAEKERRKDWTRVTKWSSTLSEFLGISRPLQRKKR
jgi:hypothetical protein